MKLPPGDFYYDFKSRRLLRDSPPVTFTDGMTAIVIVCGMIAGLEWHRTGELLIIIHENATN